MPSNPLTPPAEFPAIFALGLNLDVGEGLVTNFAQYGSQQFASPVSNVNMGFDEKSELEDRDDFQEMSDDDQGMSDGGAPLDAGHSLAEQMDLDMDVVGVQTTVVSVDNLNWHTEVIQLPTMLENGFPGSPGTESPSLPEIPDHSNHHPHEFLMHNQGHEVTLPNTMSAVSLQLQHFQDQHLQEEHLQDGLEHAESVGEEEDPESAFNSTASNFLPSFDARDGAAGSSITHSSPHPIYVSLVDIVTSSNTQVSAGSQSALNPWSIEDSNSFSAPGVALPHLSQQSDFIPVTGGTTSFTHSAVSISLTDDISEDEDSQDEADHGEVQDSRNHNLIEFLLNWNHQFSRLEDSRRRPRGIAIPSLVRPRNAKLLPVQRRDLRGERCDIQGIDWWDLGVTRVEARQMRRHTYRNYTSIPQRPSWNPSGSRISDDESFFRFRKMDFEHNIHLSHFQLRNLLACATRDHIFYAAPSKVLHCSPQSNKDSSRVTVAMDLTDSVVQPFHSLSTSIHITTLTEGHDILVAGGYDGQYSLMNLKASKSTKHTVGTITDHQNSITNHVQVHLSRGSSLPLATFASNDNVVRVLDINTNKFVAKQDFDHAINCTAISPDQRLRVMVGDTRQVLICNASTGEVLQSLEGHRDYGFACDWADDGWTVASGNQDKQVKIWDARKWTNSAGIAQPVTTIAAEMAGVRKLKFSPMGSGKRVLIAAEPADIVNVIDGETFSNKQTLSFFGEIGGVDFTNDGQDLVVANCDPTRGGLMEFERCDFAGGSAYGLEEYKESRFRNRIRRRQGGYDSDGEEEEDLMAHPRSRGTNEQRRRKPASLGISMGYF